MYRNGEGGGRRNGRVAPDLRYTTGREGESSAGLINGMGKKLIQNREQLFRQATPTSN